MGLGRGGSITFQRDSSQVPEKDSPGLCTWQEGGVGGRERIYKCKFSKVNALNKGNSWNYGEGMMVGGGTGQR